MKTAPSLTPHLLAIALLAALPSLGNATDPLLGIWWDAPRSAQIEIYARDSHYFGKIHWIDPEQHNAGDGPHRDIHNPDPQKQDRLLVGLDILRDFRTNTENTYTGGTIYDPASGKTYSAKISLQGDQLKLRGYIGISLLGRTETWTRSTESGTIDQIEP